MCGDECFRSKLSASTAYDAGDAVGVALQLCHLGRGGADVPHSHAWLVAALEEDKTAYLK